MAEVQASRERGHPGDFGAHEERAASPLVALTNIAGAVLSVSLIVGVAIWGYKLVVRDVSGIPVVRAAEGDMRVRPKEPGGQLARNQGLAVNAVAAAGTAEGPAERLVLAPVPVDLTEDDMTLTAEEPVVAPEPIDVDASLEVAASGDVVAALVRELGAKKVTIVPEESAEAPAAPVVDAALEKPAIEGGLAKSLRPVIRGAFSVAATKTPAAAHAGTGEVEVTDIRAGTRLVQLGAFDSPEIARGAWDKLSNRFGAYLEGKDRVIQQASSGGRTFYRLRAHGFEDLSDARRFCSALVAEGADCIPVVAR